MKRSSVFYLCLLLLGCKPNHQYTMDQLIGTYETVETKKDAVIDLTFWNDHTSGWEYDHPVESYDLSLYSDSSYDIDCVGGGSFECANDYWGTWMLSHDSVYLFPIGNLVWVGLEQVRQVPPFPSDHFDPHTIQGMTVPGYGVLVPFDEKEFVFRKVND